MEVCVDCTGIAFQEKHFKGMDYSHWHHVEKSPKIQCVVFRHNVHSHAINAESNYPNN